MKLNEKILEGIAQSEGSQPPCNTGNCSQCQVRVEVYNSETLQRLMQNIYYSFANQKESRQWPDLMVQVIILDAFSLGFNVAIQYQEVNELERIR